MKKFVKNFIIQSVNNGNEMKILDNKPKDIIRITISKFQETSLYINLIECTQKEAIEKVKNIIEKCNLSPFQEGKSTMITFREAKGGINGKAKNVSFKGLTVLETYNLIIFNIENEN